MITCILHPVPTSNGAIVACTPHTIFFPCRGGTARHFFWPQEQMPPARKTHWSSNPVPSTAQQRIQYLMTCQNWFSTIAQQKPFTPALAPPRKGRAARIGDRGSGEVVYVGDEFACACCGEAATVTGQSAQVVNPHGFWWLLVCESCRDARVRAHPSTPREAGDEGTRRPARA